MALIVLTASTGVAKVQPGNGSAPAPNRVTVVSASDHHTISWDVRTGEPVRLHLYRVGLDGAETLVGEFLAPQGISSFHTVDHSPVPGLKTYRLTANHIDGTEVILGSITCIELGFESGSDSMVSAARLDLTAVIPEIADHLHGGATCAGFSGGLCRREWLNGPDPPVPRTLS